MYSQKYSRRTHLIVKNAKAVKSNDFYEENDPTVKDIKNNVALEMEDNHFSVDNEYQVILTEFNRSVKDTENNMTMDNNFLVENENQVILTELVPVATSMLKNTIMPTCSFWPTVTNESFDDTDEDCNFVTDSEESSTDEDKECDLKRNKHKVNNNHKKTKISEVKVHTTAETNSDFPNEQCESFRKRGRKINKGETRDVRDNRSKQRNLGNAYVTRKGKTIRAKTFRELQICRMKCKNRIDTLKRKAIFKEFWEMGSFNNRVSFIAGLISSRDKGMCRKKVAGKKHKDRTVTHKYALHVNGENKEVCKKCFLTTFDITNRFVTDVIKNKKQSTCGITHPDLRGKGEPHNKTPKDDINLVISHISLIPTYESHYPRKDSTRKYLPSHYTLKRM
ncbi:unnamed protein product [Psylliodes chrysocephalus]|uniref:Uncharacterized protein n=1 Tax=Psylliodes chrysocephalus TaxID=3402493 RepID=A0A9P0D532_9CUCU|nr:unnamed protein product [Psylliodes chrysocephala]